MMRYKFSIRHVPGKELNTADFLSRSPPLNDSKIGDNLSNEVEAYIQLIVKHLPATDNRLIQIRKYQEQDTVLKDLRSKCLRGGTSREYGQVFSELSVKDGLLMRGSQIVIPKVLQQEVLEQIHSGHQGLNKCKERARLSVWWPGITKSIEKYVNGCRTCCQFQKPKVEPLCLSELPQMCWQKVGTDLFVWNQATYVLVIDYYSRYIEIAKLTSLTSEGVITHLKSIFARHGIPHTVVSDNGPQYSSSSFATFADQYGFCHITSSPRYPQANGEAERAVQTVKNLLKKSTDPYLALLSYRSTPIKLGYSPAELLMSRRLRTTVPVSQKLLEPRAKKTDCEGM